MTTPALTDLLLEARGTASYKLLISDLAKAIVENYAGSSLAGSAQSIKTALDSLNSKIAVTTVVATEGALPLYVSKLNGILYLRMPYSVPNTAITAGQWTLLGKVPETYRPSATSYFGGVFTSAQGEVFGFRGSVNASGEIFGIFEKDVPLSVNLFGTVITFL